MTETKTMTVRRLSDGTVSLVTENTNLIARTPEQILREVDWFIRCEMQNSNENPATTKEDGAEPGISYLPLLPLANEAEQHLRQIALENAVKSHGHNMAEITTGVAAEYLRFLRTGMVADIVAARWPRHQNGKDVDTPEVSG